MLAEAYNKINESRRYSVKYYSEAGSEVEAEIRKLLEEYITEMGTDSYFGSHPGIPSDEIEEIAKRVAQMFNPSEKDNI